MSAGVEYLVGICLTANFVHAKSFSLFDSLFRLGQKLRSAWAQQFSAALVIFIATFYCACLFPRRRSRGIAVLVSATATRGHDIKDRGKKTSVGALN
jgi:hypothetical protein